jgi:hypothetical protein
MGTWEAVQEEDDDEKEEERREMEAGKINKDSKGRTSSRRREESHPLKRAKYQKARKLESSMIDGLSPLLDFPHRCTRTQ